jgi:hypothetical protein
MVFRSTSIVAVTKEQMISASKEQKAAFNTLGSDLESTDFW